MVRSVHFTVNFDLLAFGIGFTMEAVKEQTSGDNGLRIMFHLLWLHAIILVNFGQEN